MVATRNNSIGLKDYFQCLKDKAEYDREKAKISLEELRVSIIDKRSAIVPHIDRFKLPVIDYPEFQQNKYINGMLEDAAKSMYQDTRLNLEDKHIHFRLVSYAVALRKVVEYETIIDKANRTLKVSFNDYRDFIRLYYTEVQRNLILKGYGYRLVDKLGWICINRVLNTGKKIIDFQATRINREKLIAEGKKIYNKEEAEWCEANGIEYNAIKPEEYTVYKEDEAWYELCLIGCRLSNNSDVKIKPVDYRAVNTRNYTLDQLRELSNNDNNKIMNLDMGLKYKLKLCLENDKILYTKFIRNENQTKSNFGQISWKG